ncbi:MAG: hypothetical protein GEU93_16800 [Propionibacteriales bacterium]|nr:hypothetical protein [Propionibacteriales bacterium]MPZ67456.1 hypothetical protein [Pseudonocardiaceae bacterium]
MSKEDIQKLIIYTDNALLNETDRARGGGPFGMPLPPGAVASTGLDRDFYAAAIAADLGSSVKRVNQALNAATRPPHPMSSDQAHPHLAGDPDSSTAADAAWRKAWLEMAENLCTRARHLIETTSGPVPQPDPLKAIGIDLPPEE